ncbi:MAG TPA: AtzH-like domain-containing protein [Pseudonocardiaceae bacterium]|nr:AtzH-like domain-containing protein [Pseudonocardiaceae bacterium]
MTSVPECTDGPKGTDQVVVNRPAVVADVRAAFERYETALVAGDVATLNELFWDSPSSLRFGIADRQRGAAEIHHWRRRHGGVPAGRRLRDTDVLTVDGCTAVVTTLFDYPDRPIEGRQTQVWVRFPEGWRIVAAHVSEVDVAEARHPNATDRSDRIGGPWNTRPRREEPL